MLQDLHHFGTDAGRRLDEHQLAPVEFGFDNLRLGQKPHPGRLQAGVVGLEIVHFVQVVQKAFRQVQAEIVFIRGLFEDEDARGAHLH